MSNELGVANTALFIKLKQLERIDYHPFDEYLSNDMDIWKEEL